MDYLENAKLLMQNFVESNDEHFLELAQISAYIAIAEYLKQIADVLKDQSTLHDPFDQIQLLDHQN